MSQPSALHRYRRVRWLVYAGALGLAGVLVAGISSSGSGHRNRLPVTDAASLVAAVRSRSVSAFSGTVVSKVDLGLPHLPGDGDRDSDDGLSVASLLYGAHTVQVWYGGPDQQRVALLGAMAELDIFRSGRQVWTWNSAARIAEHAVLPEPDAVAAEPTVPVAAGASPGAAPMSNEVALQSGQPSLASVLPQELALPLLSSVGSATTVTVAASHDVADRPAYELVLTPNSGETLVGSVHIAIDGATKLPLAVQVYPRGTSDPAIDVSFSNVRMAAPPVSDFSFTPPQDATVEPLESDVLSLVAQAVGTAGSGWGTIATADIDQATVHELESAAVLPAVSGSWGHGLLLRTSLVSVLVTDQGQVYCGAVEPAQLYAAAAGR